MKVKIFLQNQKTDPLEEDINKFLESEKLKFIDLKFHASVYGQIIVFLIYDEIL